MAVELYFDNLHDQLYALEADTKNLASAASAEWTVGLSDFGELPGQSTWHIRSILFKVQGLSDMVLAGNTLMRINAGIVSRDIAYTPYEYPGSYQDVAGWPLKGVFTELLCQSTPQQNTFSYQKLWKPSKNLTLNREQNINMTVKNASGGNLAVTHGLIYIHAERGN